MSSESSCVSHENTKTRNTFFISSFRAFEATPLAAALFALLLPAVLLAQRGRGGAPQGPPATGQSAAPIDLTGYWVSMIVDEWRFRVSPQKGDIAYLPINAAAR